MSGIIIEKLDQDESKISVKKSIIFGPPLSIYVPLYARSETVIIPILI